MRVNPLLTVSALLLPHLLSQTKKKRDSENIYPSQQPFQDENVDLLGPLQNLPVLRQKIVVLRQKIVVLRQKIVVLRQKIVFLRFFYALSTVCLRSRRFWS